MKFRRWFVLWLLFAPLLSAQSTLPSLVREATVTSAQDKTDMEAPFQVSEGVHHISVEADELSVPVILNGIRRGHVFIDLTSSHDKLLDMDATVGSRHARMGEDLTASNGMPVQLDVHVAACAGDQVHLLADGHESPALAPLDISGSDETLQAHWTASNGRHWLRVEVRDGDGTLLVLGNPIYVNFPTR